MISEPLIRSSSKEQLEDNLTIIHSSIGVYLSVHASFSHIIVYHTEMVIAGNILRYKCISVAHVIWFVCSKITNDLFLSGFIIGELAKLHDQLIS